ncbi:MAG TPA: response regulator [Thermodesulfobacteriota bacterium]|nr:response regulator [Thermodesulfobacteriota bacterium]
MANRETVLIVDDEIGPRESLRMILHPLYQVFTAADGEEALQWLSKQKIDLVTLDMKMPGLSGMDVLKEIRARNSEVDVIMVSGYMTSANTKEAKSCGVAAVIHKPYNVTDIVAAVGKRLEQRKYTRTLQDLMNTMKSLEGSGAKTEDPSIH